MVLTLISIMLVLLILGFPMMVPMIVAPLVILLLYFPNMDPMLITQQLIAGVQPFVLLAVPMFIFAADIIIVTLQAAIGAATPPFGCDIFTACAVFNKSYLDVIRRTPPFILLTVLAAILLIFFSDIALWTRNLVMR